MARLIIFLLFLLPVMSVSAATFTVERDGSGDFMVIQDAVDAAASGDTIRIGPGRYNEGQMVSTPGWTEFVRVLVHQNELTLMGSGPEETIIGPEEPYTYSQGWNRGIEAGPSWGSNLVRVSGIGFENMWTGITGFDAPAYIVDNCQFNSTCFGIKAIGSGDLVVEQCQFYLTGEDGNHLFTGAINSVEVRDCVFEMAEAQSGYQFQVHIENSGEVQIDNCQFLEGKTGLGILGGSFAAIRSCQFLGQSSRGIACGYSNVLVSSCYFEDQGEAFFVLGESNELHVSDSVIMNVSQVSFDIDTSGILEVSNCILAHGPEFTIRQSFNCDKSTSGNLPLLDLRNNDWGTDNADTIASWIHVCDYEVDFIPFIGQPVATKSTSLGGLKAYFR